MPLTFLISTKRDVNEDTLESNAQSQLSPASKSTEKVSISTSNNRHKRNKTTAKSLLTYYNGTAVENISSYELRPHVDCNYNRLF